jgi:hypothetical protein
MPATPLLTNLAVAKETEEPGSVSDPIKEAVGMGKQAVPDIPSDVEVPTIGNAVSQAVAKASAKRSAVARSRSIFTSPLGLGVAADTAKKILLGS